MVYLIVVNESSKHVKGYISLTETFSCETSHKTPSLTNLCPKIFLPIWSLTSNTISFVWKQLLNSHFLNCLLVCVFTCLSVFRVLWQTSLKEVGVQSSVLFRSSRKTKTTRTKRPALPSLCQVSSPYHYFPADFLCWEVSCLSEPLPVGVSVHQWGTEEVGVWLDFLCLTEYKDIFIGHDVRGPELIHLERRDLKVTLLPVNAVCYLSVPSHCWASWRTNCMLDVCWMWLSLKTRCLWVCRM